ncbi:MAG: ML domain-containing protein [Thiofilum sp.]|uniref:ML domain-containing protein n=1 Tax=Thiofilum sp. TaxID=2212733 RepID=UPI0025FCFE3A|nr:ML domain-containing protein [Thiofilum sp.]MBK8453815.1 hypothetical protein [Thiofilum sp.]
MPQETCNWSYTITSDASCELLKITSFSVSTTRINPGQTIECRLQGSLLRSLEEGAYADVIVKLGSVSIWKKTYDLNEVLGKIGKPLPQPEGDFDLVWQMDLPKEIPLTKFIINLSAFTFDEDELASAKLTVDMNKKY